MKSIQEILIDVQNGKISLLEAEGLLKTQYIEHIDGMVQLDVFRHRRTGVPEVIFAESKSPEITVEIAQKMLDRNQFAIISRMKPEHQDAILSKYSKNPDIEVDINTPGRMAFLRKKSYQLSQRKGKVGIITAGTSDIPIGEEARTVLRAMGIETIHIYDVGIAGIHRIFPPLENMVKSGVDVVIVVAGMEGTLPGVVSSLLDLPVIAVPASTGYGFGAHGQGALTTMLQSCSPGLAVVNIDNGFGAAALASLILKRIYDRNLN